MVNSCNWLTARVTRVATRSTSARGTVNVEVATGYCQVSWGRPYLGSVRWYPGRMKSYEAVSS